MQESMYVMNVQTTTMDATMDVDVSCSSSSVDFTLADEAPNYHDSIQRTWNTLCAARVTQHREAHLRRHLPLVVANTPGGMEGIKATDFVPALGIPVGMVARGKLTQATRGRVPASARCNVPPVSYPSVFRVMHDRQRKKR